MADASPVCGGVLADAKCDVRKSKTATKNSTARLMHWIMTTIPGDNLIGRTTIQLARQPRTRRGQGGKLPSCLSPKFSEKQQNFGEILCNNLQTTLVICWRRAGVAPPSAE
jgi:hypothetical protein